MREVKLLLTPDYGGVHISEMNVDFTIEGAAFFAGEELFHFNLNTVGKKFCELTRKVEMKDEKGSLSYECSENVTPNIVEQQYFVSRNTMGKIRISYTVRLVPVGKNPCFDLGYEENGINGSGMTFLPYFKEYTNEDGRKELHAYRFSIVWDLANVPEGYRGICSFGEGDVCAMGNGEMLAESFYYAGDIEGIRKSNSGFYWLKNTDYPGRETGEFVLNLFERMAEFFEDGEAPYYVFARSVKRELTGRNKVGGAALIRSFTYLYPNDESVTVGDLKFLFPHEMVHNWLTLDDNPFGTGTWYVEGTAEYYSVVLADRFGLTTKEELIAQLNKRAKDYYENPMNRVTNQYAGEHLFADQEATLVPYGRGFFYLLSVDEKIRRATNGSVSLDDVVLAILRRTRCGESCGNEVWLEEVKRFSGLDISAEFRQMQNGMLIKPVVSSFKTSLEVVEESGKIRGTGEKCILYQFR